MKLYDCGICRDTGFEDHAGYRLIPCDHMAPLPPLPDLLPCPNPNCEGSAPRYKNGPKTGEYIMCMGCGLSVTDGGQNRLYATWNGLLRCDPGPPKAWLYANRFGDAELIFNRNTEYATRLREQGYSEDPLYLGARIAKQEAANV